MKAFEARMVTAESQYNEIMDTISESMEKSYQVHLGAGKLLPEVIDNLSKDGFDVHILKDNSNNFIDKVISWENAAEHRAGDVHYDELPEELKGCLGFVTLDDVLNAIHGICECNEEADDENDEVSSETEDTTTEGAADTSEADSDKSDGDEADANISEPEAEDDADISEAVAEDVAAEGDVADDGAATPKT